MKPVLVLEHERGSPPGLFGAWLDARELPWEHWTLSDGVPLAPEAFTAIVSLGSECGANDPEPWIDRELALLRDAIDAEVPILGLCFGAQLLARAAGGLVTHGDEGEFGWIAVDGPPGTPLTNAPWFCWHDDVFTVPPGGSELARTALCPQAYVLGPHAGFQFHPEVDAATVANWLELRAQPHRAPIELAATIAATPRLLQGLEERAFALFDWWLERVEEPWRAS